MTKLSANFLRTLRSESEAAKQRLLLSLNGDGAGPILIAGAGCSWYAGYPTWEELTRRMNKVLLRNSLTKTDSESLAEFADRILMEVSARDHDLRRYTTFLGDQFKREVAELHFSGRASFHPVHAKLAQMPFAGVATTNYDCVLEDALYSVNAANNVGHEVAEGNATPPPTSVDLKEDSLGLVLDFLRSLSTAGRRRFVLHLHGVCTNAGGILLTRSELENAYAPRARNSRPAGDAAHALATGPDGDVLDTLHRKVLWSLLTMHSVVFVGFDPTDPFFSLVLRVFMRDFGQSSERHFALVPLPLYETQKTVAQLQESLRGLGVDCPRTAGHFLKRHLQVPRTQPG